MEYDEIQKAKHYNEHPSGIECIEVVQYFNFCLGNAVKYIWRAGLKSEDQIKDLEKRNITFRKKFKELRKKKYLIRYLIMKNN